MQEKIIIYSAFFGYFFSNIKIPLRLIGYFSCLLFGDFITVEQRILNLFVLYSRNFYYLATGQNGL